MSLDTADFEALERRVAQRDEDAFESLHRAYAGLVHKFVSFHVHQPLLASSVTAAIFETAWEKCDRYPWRDFTFHVWLLRLARAELENRGLYQRHETWLDGVL